MVVMIMMEYCYVCPGFCLRCETIISIFLKARSENYQNRLLGSSCLRPSMENFAANRTDLHEILYEYFSQISLEN